VGLQDDVDFAFEPEDLPEQETQMRVLLAGRQEEARFGTESRVKELNVAPVVEELWAKLHIASKNWGQFVAFQEFEVHRRGSTGGSHVDEAVTTKRDSILTSVKLSAQAVKDLLGVAARADGPRHSALFQIRCDRYEIGDALGRPSGFRNYDAEIGIAGLAAYPAYCYTLTPYPLPHSHPHPHPYSQPHP